MKRLIGKYLLLAVLLLIPVAGWGQKRFYTKSYRIRDFQSKTTKIVLGGSEDFNRALRLEVTSLWTISPYEFCTPAEYEKQKTNPDNWFLLPETSKGILFLTLSKGGKESDPDVLKQPLTLLSLPIGGEQDSSGIEVLYLPAFISMVQDYTEAALNSDLAIYLGIRAIKKRMPKGYTLYTNPVDAASAFRSMEPDAAVQITISPTGEADAKPRYTMRFGTSSYQLYYFAKR